MIPDSKYYYSFEERYEDLSLTSWQKYDKEGVVTASKQRLLKQYKIGREELYHNDQSDYYYHPVLIAQCALGCYNLIEKGKSKQYSSTFWANINWLFNNGVETNGSLVYPFPFGLPDFHPEPNWVSGMYQGQILSAFVRAYRLTKEREIFDLCNKVWNSFQANLGSQYGFRHETGEELWFEEAPQLPPKHILNGAIYAIWGIYDYLSINPNDLVRNTWVKSVNTIAINLSKYDTGYWSYYDQAGNLASYHYHNSVHIKQLQVLGVMTGNQQFTNYANTWTRYGSSAKCRLLKKWHSLINIITRRRARYNKRLVK